MSASERRDALTRERLLKAGNAISALGIQQFEDSLKHRRLMRDGLSEHGQKVNQIPDPDVSRKLPNVGHELSKFSKIEGQCVRFIVEVHLPIVAGAQT